MALPDRDFFGEQSEALCIDVSEKNFIKSLWDLYCSKIEGLNIASSNNDELHDRGLSNNNEHESPLSAKDLISDVLKTINDSQEPDSTTTLPEQIDWLDEQITILNRLKADLELSLRNASEASQ
jgi:hypothetical protein